MATQGPVASEALCKALPGRRAFARPCVRAGVSAISIGRWNDKFRLY